MITTTDIRIRGVKKTQLRLTGMLLRSKTFEPIFIKAKKKLEAANVANFTAQGLPVGGWAPLDPTYAAWKMARFPGRPMLIGDGSLFRSVANLSRGVSSFGPTRAEFGTNVEYAKFHQYGTSKMPKRKIIFEPAGFAKSTAQDAARYVVGE